LLNNAPPFTTYVRPAITLISGGKDSVYATHLALWHGFDLRVAGTVIPHADSWILQHENAPFAHTHAEALHLPWYSIPSGSGEDAELDALKTLLEDAVDHYDIEWVIVGALASDYQRVRFNYVAKDLGLRVYSPIWHLEPRRYLKQLVRDGFEFIITRVAAEGLDETWLGRRITKENVDELITLAEEHSFNPAGEGGEYESFMVKTPLYELDVSGRAEGKRFIIEEVAILDSD